MDELLYTLIVFAQEHLILTLHLVAGVLVVLALPIALFIESRHWGVGAGSYESISRRPSTIDTSRIDRASVTAKQRMRARSQAYLHHVHDTLRREP